MKIFDYSMLMRDSQYRNGELISVMEFMSWENYVLNFLIGIYICNIMSYIFHAKSLRARDLSSEYQTQESLEKVTEYKLTGSDNVS